MWLIEQTSLSAGDKLAELQSIRKREMKRQHKLLSATLLLMLTGLATLSIGVGSLGAQPPPRVTGSSYQPGIDVLDYDVRLELPDTGAFLRGDLTVTALRAPSATRLRLDLVDSMHVRIVEVNGSRVRALHSRNSLDVPLPEGAGDSVRVRVVYDGISRDGLIVRKDDRGRWTWFGDNWPDRARHWLPTVDHPSDKATVSWTVRSPERNVVVANGAWLAFRYAYYHDLLPNTYYLKMVGIPLRIRVGRGFGTFIDFLRPVFVLLRAGDIVAELLEVIADSAASGAPVHVVLLNIMALVRTPEALGIVDGARAHGLDVDILLRLALGPEIAAGLPGLRPAGLRRRRRARVLRG